MRPIVPTASTAARGPLKVLVADDNAALRAILRAMLASMGHLVEVVADGRAAVERACRGAFDVIFLDVEMPELDGFGASESIRRATRGERGPRIIGISADEADRASVSASGMDEFLVKPVRIADLARALRGGGGP